MKNYRLLLSKTLPILFVAVFMTSNSSAGENKVEVIDQGQPNKAKEASIHHLPFGTTRIIIKRDSENRISKIEIDQSAAISSSGVALEISDVLFDLIRNDRVTEAPEVNVAQAFTLEGLANVKGVRFGASSHFSDLLKNINLRITQNIPLIDVGQSWTTQDYEKAHITDFNGLVEFGNSLVGGPATHLALHHVARFPGVDGVYKSINIDENIKIVKGSLQHIGIESASAYSSYSFNPSNCVFLLNSIQSHSDNNQK